MVVGPPSTVPPVDCFLGPVSDRQGSYKQGSRITLVYQLGPLPSQHLLGNFSSSSVRLL